MDDSKEKKEIKQDEIQSKVSLDSNNLRIEQKENLGFFQIPKKEKEKVTKLKTFFKYGYEKSYFKLAAIEDEKPLFSPLSKDFPQNLQENKTKSQEQKDTDSIQPLIHQFEKTNLESKKTKDTTLDHINPKMESLNNSTVGTFYLYQLNILKDQEKILIEIMNLDCEIEKVLYQTDYILVYVLKHITEDKRFALKVVKVKNVHEQYNLENEIHNLQKVKGDERFAQIIDFKKLDRTTMLITFNLLKMTLRERMFSLDLKGKLETMINICGAVESLHLDYRIIHHDLKPDNIMMNENDKPVLIDFGFTKLVDTPDEFMMVCFTKGYCDPLKDVDPNTYQDEIKPKGKDFGVHNDNFSLGVIMYVVFSLKPPFAINNSKYLESIYFPEDFPKEIKPIVLKLCTLNKEERFSATDALDELYKVKFE